MRWLTGHTWSRIAIGAACGMALVGLAKLAGAQQSVATTPRTGESDTDANALLARPVSIRIDNASVRQAIDILAAQANILIAYRRESVDAGGRTVSVNVTRQPLGTVLFQVLAGTNLRVVVTAPDAIALKLNEARVSAMAIGIVSGTITDAKTKRPLRRVSVALDDTLATTRTDDNGRYRFAQVVAGEHRLSVRFVGYARQSRVVTIVDEQTAAVDFALESSTVNTLDQVVVTATGEQRERELGHIVAHLNVDSIVKNAPITDLTDLLQGRVPGLQVVSGSGSYAGGTVMLQLRGQSSLALQSQPIIFVDGVRYQADNSLSNGANDQDLRGTTSQQRSPINDLNPNDIESIDVVKGPSASTLYGPDAANGVIVITTKRGKVGAPRFSWYARPLSNATPKPNYATRTYTVWSHVPGSAQLFPYPCTLIRQYIDHSCVVDSITSARSVVQVDSLSPVASTRPAWQYGASFSGGTQAARYFLSGNYTNQIGALRIPPALRHVMERQFGQNAFGDLQSSPNSLRNVNVQGSIASDVSSWFSVDGSVNYTSVDNNRSASPVIYSNALQVSGLAFADSSQLHSIITNQVYDLTTALTTSVEETGRTTGSASANFHPTSWLSATGLFGTDIDNLRTHTERAGGKVYAGESGMVGDEYRQTIGRNAGVNVTTNSHAGPFSFRTTGGVQYTYHRLVGTSSFGFGLPTGSVNLSLAQSKSITPYWDENVELGGFGEEVLGIRDRLFLTASLRVDGSTTFGDAYHPTPFPKMGVSWIASEEPFLRDVPGLHELRFRYSYGSATRYPTSPMKIGVLNASGLTYNNTYEAGYFPATFANPDLKPERSNEHEWGSDATILNGTTLRLTWWRRDVIDELTERQGQHVGFRDYWINGATVAKHGYEVSATVPVFSSSQTDAEIAFNYAYQTSKVVSLPSGQLSTGGTVGYPLDARFGRPIVAVLDTAGGHPDSVVVPSEIIRTAGDVFLGVINPPRTFAIAPSIRLLNGVVQISSLFDHAADFLATDDFGPQCQYTASCLALFSKATPLLEQARYVQGNRDYDFNRKTTYTSWREFTIRASLPQSVIRRFNIAHFQLINGASVSFQGRNIFLWSSYKGTDPQNRTDADPTTSNFSDGMPTARTWGFRFDITP